MVERGISEKGTAYSSSWEEAHYRPIIAKYMTEIDRLREIMRRQVEEKEQKIALNSFNVKVCASFILALAASVAAASTPAQAQTLTHRYSMNGNANDSVGGANGIVMGKVTFTMSAGVNGTANFPGGNSGGTPSPPSYIRLPSATVRNLQDATVEVFVTSFSGGMTFVGGNNGYYQALFAVSSPYTDGTTQSNYAILTVNRDPANLIGAGIGIAGRTSSGPETTIASGFALPKTGGLVTLVFQGYKKVGDMGTETIYLNGDLVAKGGTFFSYKDVAEVNGVSGTVVFDTVGIGGGSPYNDFCFNGTINEVRIWSGALTAAQVLADYKAGPSTVAAIAPSAH